MYNEETLFDIGNCVFRKVCAYSELYKLYETSEVYTSLYIRALEIDECYYFAYVALCNKRISYE